MRTLLLSFFLLGIHPLPAQDLPEPELLEPEYLYELVRHLYRWQLDEQDAELVIGKQHIPFWIRAVQPHLDPDDGSLFAEIVIPDLNVRVSAKKADYAIPELQITVKSDRFKVTNVSRGPLPETPDGFTEVNLSYGAIRDYAHRTRALSRFPDGPLLARMRKSAREQIKTYLEDRQRAGLKHPAGSFEELANTEQVIHVSPLSAIANEIWIFWEHGRMLIRFASDLDLENPAVWEHDDLAVELFNIDEQTVVSLDEVAGSNAYMTRDQVGRTLFNCIVLGKRLVLEARATSATQDEH